MTTDLDEYVSLGEAAKRTGVSLRTLARWAKQGRIPSTRSKFDARKRLVPLAAVETLAGESRSKRQRRRTNGTDGQTGNESQHPPQQPDVASERNGALRRADAIDDQEIIDQVLDLVYTHTHRFLAQLDLKAKPATMEELRQSQLGQDLQQLALIANGELRAPKEEVLTAIDSVLAILFWPVAAEEEEFTVPMTFWDTECGRMLSAAKYRAFDRRELVSISEAAQQLGVTRATIYRWMDERILNFVRDDLSNRTYVVRRDMGDLQEVRDRHVHRGEDQWSRALREYFSEDQS